MDVTVDFSDSWKLLERKLMERYKSLTSATEVDIGFFPEHFHSEAKVPLAQVAAWNEFGAGFSPPRPFMRYSVIHFGVEWADIIRVSLKATNYDAKAALTAAGQLATVRIQAVIKAWSEPPNAPATIRKKGFNDPLIETGYMLRHVTYKVDAK